MFYLEFRLLTLFLRHTLAKGKYWPVWNRPCESGHHLCLFEMEIMMTPVLYTVFSNSLVLKMLSSASGRFLTQPILLWDHSREQVRPVWVISWPGSFSVCLGSSLVWNRFSVWLCTVIYKKFKSRQRSSTRKSPYWWEDFRTEVEETGSLYC